MSRAAAGSLRQEWRILQRDRGFRALLALLALLCAYAGASGVRGLGFQERAIGQAQAEEAARVGALRAQTRELEAAQAPALPRADPRDAGGVGRGSGAHYAVQPPGVLAALNVGQSDLEPAYYRITARPASSFLADAELANPLHLLEGPFDLAFVVLYALPLLLFALSYDLLSGERERGTLPMLLAQPVSLGRVLLVRAALRLAALIAVIGAAAAAIALLSGSAAQPGAVPRLLGWVAVSGVYGAFWLAAALALNALRLPSAVNALGCAGLWLLGVLVAPALLNVAIAKSYPQPSRLQLIHAVREASNEAAEQQGQVLARYFEDHPELARGAGEAAPAAAQTVAAQEHVEAAVTPLLAAFEERKRARQDLTAAYSVFSPALLAQRALADLAGTGEARHRLFLDQVRVFHGQWREFFLPRLFRSEPLSEADYANFPRFHYQDEPAPAALARAALPTALLALGTGVLLAAALWLLARPGAALAVVPRAGTVAGATAPAR